MSTNPAATRAEAFCERFGLTIPILQAPMGGASPSSLAVAVTNAGGMGACGAVLMSPDEIVQWARETRKSTEGPFQMNLWIPDPPPVRDPVHEARLRGFLGTWGPPVPAEAGDAAPQDFASQCAALLAVQPPFVSSIMGLYPTEFVAQLKARNIRWLATVTTVAEACQAQAAGADVVVVQGAEAGGHRGSFVAAEAERQQAGLFALLPAVVDAVDVPVVATGGIADGRGIAAALILGASAVQIGTGLLRSPEAQLDHAYADALANCSPGDTVVSRTFSGRAGRSIANRYVRAATNIDAPAPAPYPVQRGLTANLRQAAQQSGDPARMQMWAGQAAGLSLAQCAGDILERLWTEARSLLS